MKKLIVVSLSLIVFVSCSSSSSNNETGGDFSLLKSTLARDTSPDAAEAEITELVTGNTNFAIDLYKKIKTGENIFFSPYSVSLALAMTYAGADGNTKTEMADTLHFTLDDARLHNAFNYLDLAIMNRDSDDEDDNAFTLRIANSIWGEKTYSFLSTFLDVLAENYGAGLRAVDFANDPNISRNTINDWVSDETEGKIEDLLPEGTVTPDTRLVLTNAIYFNARWSSEFSENDTDTKTFSLFDDSTVNVDMMHQVIETTYTAANDYQAVQLYYDNYDFSMVLILPVSGKFDDIAESLDADSISAMIDGMTTYDVTLSMPKFGFTIPLALTDTLKDMGMIDAFGNADFSGMDGTYDLAITDVLHKAYVTVNEKGTEAAAATAVVVGETAAPAPEEIPTAEMNINRPFLFFIRDVESGTILFFGQVADPTAS